MENINNNNTTDLDKLEEEQLRDEEELIPSSPEKIKLPKKKRFQLDEEDIQLLNDVAGIEDEKPTHKRKRSEDDVPSKEIIKIARVVELAALKHFNWLSDEKMTSAVKLIGLKPDTSCKKYFSKCVSYEIIPYIITLDSLEPSKREKKLLKLEAIVDGQRSYSERLGHSRPNGTFDFVQELRSYYNK